MNRKVLALLAGALIAAAGSALCRRVLRQSNTQVHRISQ
jgi:hypothetical protein